MQSVGILLAVAGIWYMYCGTHGLNPQALFMALVKKPDQAGEIITSAVKEVEETRFDGWGINADKIEAGGQAGGIAGAIGNPFAQYPVTAPFGQRGHAGTFGAAHVHNGVDYGMPVGTNVPAVISGTASTGFGVLSGTTVTVTGTGGFAGWSTIYMHISHVVKSGPVKVGEIVAQSGGAKGASGSGDSTGPHLHFEVHKNGSVVDPADFWRWVASNKTNLDK